MTIAVLLTVHNRKDTTIKCLSILYGLSLPKDCSINVYLTDDGCTDGTGDEVKKKFPNVVIIKGDGNLYWNRGMIAAWKRAAKDNSDFYLWLNDDTMAYPDLIVNLYKASQQKKHEAIIVGACEYDGKFTYGGIKQNGDIASIGTDDNLIRIEKFNGNIVWVPKYVFDKLGYLDSYYRHCWGDIDYGLRAKEFGIESYQIGHYLGVCSRHTTYSKWCNPKYSLLERLKAINTPTGLAPHEVFHFEKRHIGFYTAVFHFFTVYFRCICPNLWIKLGKAKI